MTKKKISIDLDNIILDAEEMMISNQTYYPLEGSEKKKFENKISTLAKKSPTIIKDEKRKTVQIPESLFEKFELLMNNAKITYYK